ncbi:hypothetical protein JKF63_06167 [Porcisia hertigi]|uniref:Uncharacterized protein n=1 Tax=Porcisia hertigi TaxID=2761500 RepID=A0A836IZ70_9TRYP|nr:hypothetical protein JKF63_06167 [Porcisia hertigi]
MKRWRAVNLFTPAEVQRAFAALRQHAETLFGVSDAKTPLYSFIHRRGGAGGYRRDHIELPLHLMYEGNVVYQQLPAEVRLVCAGLHEAALGYAREALHEGPGVSAAARREILNNLGRKSVVRVLRYPAGSGCRPHVDPGLCTALLLGSAGGLEVSTANTLATLRANQLRSCKHHLDSLPTFLQNEEANMPATLPHWESVVTTHIGEAVVMAGSMLGVVSGGALPGVLHRVRQDWAVTTPHRDGLFDPPARTASIASEAGASNNKGSVAFRFNVIVELRPEDAKRWYAAASGQPPTAPLASTSPLMWGEEPCVVH